MGEGVAWIFLGRGHRVDFLGGLGAGGDWNRRDQEEGRRWRMRMLGQTAEFGRAFRRQCGNLMQWKLPEI